MNIDNPTHWHHARYQRIVDRVFVTAQFQSQCIEIALSKTSHSEKPQLEIVQDDYCVKTFSRAAV
jgi:hypothetical protein